MEDVPAAFAKTFPDASTLAEAEFVLVHMPPVTVSLNTSDCPRQRVPVPVVVIGMGLGLTVNVVVVVPVNPFPSVILAV